MRKAIEDVMTRYGTVLTVLRDEEEPRSVRGFFRPVNTNSWQSIESEATLLGELTRGQYVYLGPIEGDVREGDTLGLGEKTYLVRRVEIYYFADASLYQWGLCVEKGVNDTWGIQS